MSREPLARNDSTGQRRAGRVKARSFAGMSNKKFRAQSPIDSRKLGVTSVLMNFIQTITLLPARRLLKGTTTSSLF